MPNADQPTPRFSREVLGVVESPLVQIATVAERMPGSLKLCYGESDLPTPEFICRAAGDAAVAGHTFYTHTAGAPELRAAIANKVRELHGVTYEVPEIMAAVGGSAAIFTAIRACVGPGDNAVVVTPAYAIYANAVTMAGAELRQIPLFFGDDGFGLDVDRVRRAVDDRTRLIVVNSPSNPTGWVASPDEQRALLDIAHSSRARLLADEVYERLTFDAPLAPSFARLDHDRDRLIVINSFSKTYNMTGWRLGWAQGGAEVIRQMYKAAEFITSNPTALVQQAGIAALRDGEPHIRQMREQLAANRAAVVAALDGLDGIHIPDPRGAFYAFPRVHGLTDSASLALDVLQQTGVALAPGSAFGDGGEGHLRLCFAASPSTLGEALTRVSRYFEARSV